MSHSRWLPVLRVQESHCCAVLVSEEREEPIIIEGAKAGALLLPGSSAQSCYHL